jgi:hypothetical protein
MKTAFACTYPDKPRNTGLWRRWWSAWPPGGNLTETGAGSTPSGQPIGALQLLMSPPDGPAPAAVPINRRVTTLNGSGAIGSLAATYLDSWTTSPLPTPSAWPQMERPGIPGSARCCTWDLSRSRRRLPHLGCQRHPVRGHLEHLRLDPRRGARPRRRGLPVCGPGCGDRVHRRAYCLTAAWKPRRRRRRSQIVRRPRRGPA